MVTLPYANTGSHLLQEKQWLTQKPLVETFAYNLWPEMHHMASPNFKGVWKDGYFSCTQCQPKQFWLF